MKLILHGDNVIQSRLELTNLIKSSKAEETIKLNGKNIKEADLRQALESQSLFKQEKLIIIENLLTRTRSKEKTQLLSIASQTDQSIIFWEPKAATATNLKPFKDFQIKLFKTPAAIFKFLDSLKPNNAKASLHILHNQLKKEPIELIFYMLCRRISQLITASDKNAPKLLKAAPWQKSRLISQAKTFNQNKLIDLHTQLLQIDEKIKTGQSHMALASQLDLLLLSL